MTSIGHKREETKTKEHRCPSSEQAKQEQLFLEDIFLKEVPHMRVPKTVFSIPVSVEFCLKGDC